jgi:hypothetical protein
MENNQNVGSSLDVIGIVLITVGVVLLIPLVVNVASNLVVDVYNLGSQLMWDRKIKKGLKDGSIVEINGQYYNVELAERVEEA